MSLPVYTITIPVARVRLHIVSLTDALVDIDSGTKSISTSTANVAGPAERVGDAVVVISDIDNVKVLVGEGDKGVDSAEDSTVDGVCSAIGAGKRLDAGAGPKESGARVLLRVAR